MNELVGRLVAEHGIDRDVAEKAVGIILAFLIKEGPADKVKPLIDRMPGAQEAADASGGGGGFGMGGKGDESTYVFKFEKDPPAGSRIGKPIKLVWEIPTQTREIPLAFDFSDVPMP